MLSQTAVARKTSPASENDHRKRRRNRTTKSCLNCHTSKRMCDRKRPACARCVQLGLIGLCAYEISDLRQADDSQDDCTRLLKRVAELEGVIREMKRKPHPKWVQIISKPPEELERGPSGTHSPITNEKGQGSASGGPSPSSPLSESEPEVSLSDSCSLLVAHAYPSVICLDAVDRHKTSSPVQNIPLPGLGTVADVFPSQSDVFSGHNLVSEFNLSCPGSMEYSPFTSFNPVDKGSVPVDQDAQKMCANQCGCPHEVACYNVLLELSFRLRRAVDVLARSTSHQLGQTCQLHQRISELDTITVGVLGSILAPSDNFQTSFDSLLPCLQISAQSFAQTWQSAMSSESLSNLTIPDPLPAIIHSPSSLYEDDFMAWGPSRGL